MSFSGASFFNEWIRISWTALINLKNRNDLVIKTDDKGGATVVWRTDLYQQEAIRQLSDQTFYTKVNKDQTSANQKIVKDTIEELITKQELPVTAQNLIINTPRTSCIYFKPKIHKPNNPGRPIVSACSCPTELISSYIDKVMTPIVKSLPSYIKDSNHALEVFRNFNFSGENKIIFTTDITSLYTVIPNNEGLQALKYFFINVLSKNRAWKPYSVKLNWFSHSTREFLQNSCTDFLVASSVGTAWMFTMFPRPRTHKIHRVETLIFAGFVQPLKRIAY